MPTTHCLPNAQTFFEDASIFRWSARLFAVYAAPASVRTTTIGLALLRNLQRWRVNEEFAYE